MLIVDGYGVATVGGVVESLIVIGPELQTREMTFKHQPPAIEPESWPVSSFTQRFQTPLGSVPSNVASADRPLLAGAGARRVSDDPRFVGRYVPETSELPGIGPAAASLSSRSTWTRGVLLPPP